MGGNYGLEKDVKNPLLLSNREKDKDKDKENRGYVTIGATSLPKHQYRNSIGSLRNAFFSTLPDKVRPAFDPETPFDLHLSRTSGLNDGEIEYYEKQVATLNAFEDTDSLEFPLPILNQETDHIEQIQQERAINISNFSNTFLLSFKIYATIKSGSLAIAASTLDSLLDLIAGGILWFTHLSMKNTNIYQYPIGKLRVQPVGIVIFAAVMATLGFQVLIEALQQLIQNELSVKMTYEQLMWLYLIMGTAAIVKLLLWFYCKSSRNKIVRAYAKDHYFDVVTNAIGLVAAVLGDRYYWWLDPTGAIVLSLYTISNWTGTVLENAASLVGRSAPPEMLQKLTYLVLQHHHLIKHIDTVRAYTFGVLYFVEVDIELPEDLPLKEAHAIGESLQIKIEKLPEVERAFVHLDYECEHKPEHSIMVKLPNTSP